MLGPALPATLRRTRRVLIAGSSGQLATALLPAFRAAGWDAVAVGRPELDLAGPQQAIAAAVLRVSPQLVVNAAAWTAVDRAEDDPQGAMAVNRDGAGALAAAAEMCGAALLHVSTDYVFDGSKRAPWVESDPVGPLQAYGRTKLAGERAVATANPEHAIARTAWLFGAGGRNFADTMLGLFAERDEVEVVADQTGHPTWTGHLAPALVELAERDGDVGVFHAAGHGQCTWYEFAVEIAHAAELPARVVPTTSARFVRPAVRPAYSVLGTERAPGVVLPAWQDGLGAYLDERAGQVAA
jgi:dTDP-4-dehydrorhamnose reductase